MDLYKLPKDMLVKMVSEIRKDVEKEYEIYKTKVIKAEEAGVYFQKCNAKDCVNLYAKVKSARIDDDFFYCEFCDKEYCDDHQYYCDSCDGWYCIYCHKEHLVFCEKCNTRGCKFDHDLKCDVCGTCNPNIYCNKCM